MNYSEKEIIAAATGEFLKKYQADIDQYKISITDSADEVNVVFIDRDAADVRMLGNPSKRGLPGFVVSLSKDDLHIMKSNFIR